MARPSTGHWLGAWRTYLAASALLHLLWEVLQLPLYTLWRDGSKREIAFAVIHCTAGDLMIASLCLLGVLLVLGTPAWPRERFSSVLAAVIGLGVGYTVYSEWINTVVRKTWVYSELMPVAPVLGTGLSPLMQWLLVPALAMLAIRRRLRD